MWCYESIRHRFLSQGFRDQGKVTEEMKSLLNSAVGGQVSEGQFWQIKHVKNLKAKKIRKTVCTAG